MERIGNTSIRYGLITTTLLLNCSRLIYLAKWKSQVSSHFIHRILSTLHPGYPYVTGANQTNPTIAAIKMIPPTIHITSWS
jgi:hypothetical protein